jgi:hypothetical protein
MVTLESSLGITIKGLISGTYTDMSKCKGYLAVTLFDATTLDGQIIEQAVNVKDKINAFLGRTADFTEAELEQTVFSGIVDSASQMTACLVECNPQAAQMSYTEDSITDCEESWKTLKNWALSNGISIPDEEKLEPHPLTELIYITNDPTELI